MLSRTSFKHKTLTPAAFLRKPRPISQDDILDIWNYEPTMTYAGFDCNDATRDRLRQALLDHLDEVQLCYDWIIRQHVGKMVTYRDHSSYFLKHCVEFATVRSPLDYTYVSNGSFICAALIAKVPYKKIPSAPEAQLAIRGDRRNQKKHWQDPSVSWAKGYAEFAPLYVEVQR